MSDFMNILGDIQYIVSPDQNYELVTHNVKLHHISTGKHPVNYGFLNGGMAKTEKKVFVKSHENGCGLYVFLNVLDQ